ncbi:MAG: GtrA family protein [Bacteroidetes bacterium]|nr:GtrA family protein [Bacteroidota bacterium]
MQGKCKNRRTIRKFITRYFLPKIKFGATSSLATAIDYVLYLVLVDNYLPPLYSNLISSFVGIIANFFMQKRFIFELRRKVYHTFLLSFSFSLIGMAISTTIVTLLSRIDFFSDYQFITKIIATVIVFFYNFYSKRLAFENRITKD